jgi:hypothetical protein
VDVKERSSHSTTAYKQRKQQEKKCTPFPNSKRADWHSDIHKKTACPLVKDSWGVTQSSYLFIHWQICHKYYQVSYVKHCVSHQSAVKAVKVLARFLFCRSNWVQSVVGAVPNCGCVLLFKKTATYENYSHLQAGLSDEPHTLKKKVTSNEAWIVGYHQPQTKHSSIQCNVSSIHGPKKPLRQYQAITFWSVNIKVLLTRQCTYNVTVRRVRESLLQWKSKKNITYLCVFARARAYSSVCMHVRPCILAYRACNLYAPYCAVICGLSGSIIFFDIIS